VNFNLFIKQKKGFDLNKCELKELRSIIIIKRYNNTRPMQNSSIHKT